MRRLISFRQHHDAWVKAWLARTTKDATPAERVALLDHGLAALWRRAQPTLGDFTLAAVFERTLREAATSFPQLSRLKVEARGETFGRIGEGGSAVDDAELADALGFLLLEFLTAIGSLTGEALTPLLHRELAKATGTLPV